jgi:ABC-type amino acid transport substrate-binding protein
MHRRRFLLTAFSATGMALNVHAARAAQAKHFDIVYPQIQPGGDVHAAFALAVLDLAMKAANADYSIRQANVVMERGRALAELAHDDTINLHWTSMDEQSERGLNVVHIPIHRGLIGYRVFIIRKDRQPDFDRINGLDDLKALTAGQGLGWIDTEIMRRAGLNVQTSTYETLFTMTQGGRVDYFPRGVIEAFAELDARKQAVPDLVVENRLLLLYRSDFLFYVARSQRELAATIEKGFTAAYRNGSYMKLFNSHPYIQNPLGRANLAGRKVIRLDNPYLSEADRRIPDEYWMH